MVVQHIPLQRGIHSNPWGVTKNTSEVMEIHVHKVYSSFHKVLSFSDSDPFSNGENVEKSIFTKLAPVIFSCCEFVSH